MRLLLVLLCLVAVVSSILKICLFTDQWEPHERCEYFWCHSKGKSADFRRALGLRGDEMMEKQQNYDVE